MVIRSTRVVLPSGIQPAEIHITGDRIAAIRSYNPNATSDLPPSPLPGYGAAGAPRDLLVMPGIVDSHVHVNEPGRTDWEGFATACAAAAAGGVTTIVDMPLNSIPPTTTVAGLDAKRAAARAARTSLTKLNEALAKYEASECASEPRDRSAPAQRRARERVGESEGQSPSDKTRVNVEFWGGVVPGNAAELDGLADGGVRGFKCFLSPSGVDEFPHVAEADLRHALPILARRGLPLLVHAESPAALVPPTEASNPRTHATWLASRPARAEVDAIAMLIALCREFRAWIHVVHLAAADALPLLHAARAEGLPITVETCPHYLSFAAEDIAEGATLFKCAPPIRETGHREALWRALQDGTIDLIATDHSPCPPVMKGDGDFLQAWGGIASLELGLAAAWTGASARGVPLERIADWLCAGPARLARLADRGAIAEGMRADLVVWDPDAEFTVDARRLHQRHKRTPYAGLRLRGRVHATYVGGELVYRDGVE